MAIRILDLSSVRDWQRFVDLMPNATSHHHSGWYGVLRDAFWVTPFFLMSTRSTGEVEGILPMYHSKSPITGHHLSSLEGGILARDAVAVTELLDYAEVLRDRLDAQYVQLRGGMADERPATLVETVHTIVPTSRTPTAAWDSLKQSARRAVRKAKRANLVVEQDEELTQLRTFYDVYAGRMRELGTPVLGFDTFEAIRHHVGPECLRLYTARDQRRVVGGMLCLINSHRWTSYFAASLHSGHLEYANYALYWHVIQEAITSGTPEMDLGRSTSGSNVHVFKQRWGGADLKVLYRFYPSASIRIRDMGLQKLKTERRLPQLLWSHLPSTICNRVGPLVRKQLPFI